MFSAVATPETAETGGAEGGGATVVQHVIDDAPHSIYQAVENIVPLRCTHVGTGIAVSARSMTGRFTS